jgi:hypothetical protein
MREALGRLNSELYPPLKEQGFEIRSQGPAQLPPLIDATRRNSAGRSDKFLLPSTEPKPDASKPDAAKSDPKAKPDPKAKGG